MRRPALLLLAALLPLAGALLPARSAEARPSEARDAALVQQLKTRRLAHVAFEGQGLEDVLRWLRTATGFNFVLRRTALAKAGIEPADVTFTAELDEVTIATLLELVLEPHGLGWKVKDNVVYVTTRADALGRPVTRLYGISHITYVKTDFIAPDINLRPSDFTPVEEYEPERVVEDDPLTSGDAVVELIKELVMPESWDEEGWSIRATDRYLVVRAPLSVQREVEKALDIIATMK